MDAEAKREHIVYIFRIKNQFEDYSIWARFINAFYSGENIVSGEFDELPLRIEIDSQQSNLEAKSRCAKIKTILEQKVLDPTDLETVNKDIENNNQIYYHFEVDILEEDDVVNFQYYFLLKQLYPYFDNAKLFSLIINLPSEIENEDSLKFKISHFLILETNKDPDCVYYSTFIDKKPSRLPYTTEDVNITKFEKFFPLLEITQNTYTLLSKPLRNLVGEIFEDADPTCLIDFENPYLFIKNEGLFDIPRLFYGNAKALLKSVTPPKGYKKNYFSQSDFFKIVDNISLLTLMIFAVSMNQKNATDYDIQMEVYEAADFAEGILQLLENIVEHSENKKGYFCFRLHSTCTKKNEAGNFKFNNKYLNQQYSKYSDQLLNNKNINVSLEKITDIDSHIGKKDLSFLELFVVDTFFNKPKIKDQNLSKENKSPVVDMFLKNMEDRYDSGETDLAHFYPDVKKVSLSDFFSYSECLNDYETHHSNIARHYGLKRFSNSVSAVNGFFFAVSSYGFKCDSENTFKLVGNETPDSDFDNLPTLPGTKYQILLPLNTQYWSQLKFIGIDTNKKWEESYKTFLSGKIKQQVILLEDQSPNKNKRIMENCNSLQEQIKNEQDDENDNYFLYIIPVQENQKSNSFFSSELVSKVILQMFAKDDKNNKKEKTLVIILDNCPKYFIPEFVRYMMIAYDRFNLEKRRIMENRQIYCVGEDPLDDFLIMGNDLKEMRHHMINRSALRGAFPSFLFVMNFILGKQDSEGEIPNLELPEELPIDLLLERDGKTLFELRTENALLKLISKDEIGCKIENLHFQLGSKIHIHHFYDAEILFQSTYFSTRFAALLARDIIEKIYISNIEKNSVTYQLIGYGDYSELVVSQTKRLLEINSILNVRTHIIRQKDEWEDFKERSGESSQNEKFIFIVPINSTLTTHNKLFSWFLEFGKTKGSELLANYALVLVRDELSQSKITSSEETYWESIERKVIKTRLTESPITYFIEVEGKWENPLTCPMCYPKDSLNERPIIETNITSIIPMLKLENDDLQNTAAIDHPTHVKELSNIVKYSHTTRDENHYLFYFPPGKMVDKYEKHVRNWLKNEIVGKINKPGSHAYNFIVTQLNNTSTGFVELINEEIFKSSAQILRFDIGKEPRNNFVLKYSYISELAENINKTNEIWPITSQLNFYFVDDVIITGQTIERAKSLVNSLFNKSYQGVRYSVFEGIFVLVNRLSKDSVKNYIEIEKYHYYANFPVTPIRNHANFCYLCSKLEDFSSLIEKSSLRDLQKAWETISGKFKPITSSPLLDHKTNEVDEKSRNRAISAARLSNIVNEFKDNHEQIDENIIIITILLEIALNSDADKESNYYELAVNKQTIAVLASFLKILARPDFVYTYSIREALLKVLLFILSVMIACGQASPKSSTEYKPKLLKERMPSNDNQTLYKNHVNNKINVFNKWLKKLFYTSDEDKVWLFDLLAEQFAELSSTRMLRKDFLQYISNFEKSDWFYTEKNNDGATACDLFRMALAKITKISRDESKSLWLENLLLTGNEYEETANNADIAFLNSIWSNDSGLGMALYVENTKIIDNALNYYLKPGRSEISNSFSDLVLEGKKKHYYLDNFRTLFALNGFSLKENLSQLKLFDTNNLVTMIDNFGELVKLLTKSINQPTEKEDNFLEGLTIICDLLNKISLGCCTKIIIISTNNNNKSIQNKDTICVAESKGSNENCEHQFSYEEFSQDKFQYDTYSLQNNKLIINLADGNEHQRICLVINLSDKSEINRIFPTLIQNDEGEKNILEQLKHSPLRYAFVVRNVLLFRESIKVFIEEHLNTSSIQSWTETVEKERKLNNIKNISHSTNDNDQLERFIGKAINISSIDGFEKKAIDIQAFTYKLLADTNISTIHFESIVYQNPEYSDVEFNKSLWSTPEALSNVFNEDLVQALVQIVSSVGEMRNIVWKLPENGTIGNYYLTISSEGFLLIISIIENAIKCSPNRGTIIIEAEKTNKSRCPDNLYYLSVTNDLINVSDKPSIEKLKKQIEACILYDVEKRKGITYLEANQKNGISLYSINNYCRKLLFCLCDGIIEEIATPFSISKNDTQDVFQLKIQIPILFFTEGNENETITHR